MDCLFCKMATGVITPDVVFEDDDLMAFRDISPQAPVHILIIPKKHIVNMDDVSDADAPIIAKLLARAAQIARDLGFANEGYRLVNNCNRQGGQTVYHLHFHLLAGRYMTWPPG